MVRLSSVLVSHFLLDLQEAHQRPIVGLAPNDLAHTSQSLSSGSVTFERALGSLSATLDPTDCPGREDHYGGVGHRLVPSEDTHTQGEPTTLG